MIKLTLSLKYKSFFFTKVGMGNCSEQIFSTSWFTGQYIFELCLVSNRNTSDLGKCIRAGC